MSILPGTCEYRRFDGETPCGHAGHWLVARGRSYDAQVSCSHHLNATVTAVMGHDRLHVTVTDLTREEVTL